MSEINVTPLVDVMLVLLVVFMVAAPLFDGRSAGRSAADPGAADHRAEGAARHHDQWRRPHLHPGDRGPDRALVPRLQAITGNNPDALLYVRGDKAINYGRVLEVMSLVSSAGFRKVSLIAEIAERGVRQGCQPTPYRVRLQIPDGQALATTLRPVLKEWLWTAAETGSLAGGGSAPRRYRTGIGRRGYGAVGNVAPDPGRGFNFRVADNCFHPPAPGKKCQSRFSW